MSMSGGGGGGGLGGAGGGGLGGGGEGGSGGEGELKPAEKSGLFAAICAIALTAHPLSPTSQAMETSAEATASIVNSSATG